MADENTWWPPGYSHPAFQVRRQIFGTTMGGDYVRGGAQFKGILTGAGTSLPSDPLVGDMYLLGNPVPDAAPNPLTGIKAPGNAIRWDTSWTNLGSITQTVGTAVRYPRTSAGSASVIGKSILHVRPLDHTTVEIQWGWPASDAWLEVSLVRSAFGNPSTVNDGQTIFRAERSAFMDTSGGLPSDPLTGVVTDPPVVLDTLLPAGHWYHYGLFFKLTPVEWVRGMIDSCLLPRNLRHDKYLWDNVPPYYQWVDGNLANRGFLKTFLKIFGFELDQCREFVESWQHLYDVDWSPMRLLRKLGPNFGVPYESGIGDIRYRSLMADIGHLYEARGTQSSLTDLVSNMSKYSCDVTSGNSLMLTPDDSDFYMGIGNWAGLPSETVISAVNAIAPVGAPLAPDHVKLIKAASDEVTPPKGRGVLRVWSSLADATAKVLVTAGDGLQYPDYTTVDLSKGVEKAPKRYGIPVEPLSSYGFRVSVTTSLVPLTARAVLLWFDQRGEPYLLTSADLPLNPVGIDASMVWHDVSVEGTAPANAVFLVPGVLFTDRVAGTGSVSPYMYLAGAMVYFVGGKDTHLNIPGDRYLTMGDPSELIGAADPVGHPTFEPWLLGTPEKPQ